MSSCSCGPPVDVVRDALDLSAVLLSAGPPAEYRRTVDLLLRTPERSLECLAAVLLSVSRPGALEDVRTMALLHSVRRLEAGQ